jgi:putative ABC transport system permease protein
VLLRFVRESIVRSPGRKALIVVAVALGCAVATAMLGVMLDIGDRINQELRAEGANIVVTAQAASLTGGIGSLSAHATGRAGYIPLAEVPKVKNIFWGLNITGFSPVLNAKDGAIPVEGVWFTHPYRAPDGSFKTTGIRDVNPAWEITSGHWPAADGAGAAGTGGAAQAVAGAGAARRNHWRTGQQITLFGQSFELAGILSTGDEAEDAVLVPLDRLASLTGRPGLVDRIEVAALTKPEDDFARKNPKTMTPKEYERWSCTNYAISIAHEIEEALPGTDARLVRRVADSEGKILGSVGGLMGLITLAALLSSGLTVWSLTATSMMGRRGEVAIMQAMGAARSTIGALFGVEVALTGLAGGLIGALVGTGLAHFVGRSVFHDAISVSWVLPFVIAFAAILVSLAGAAQPLRRTLRMEPAVILREGL